MSTHVVSTIRTAMERDVPIAFRYRRLDGKETRHNAIYPRRLDMEGEHQLLHAYCHFTRDERTFRLDRIQSIRLGAPRRLGIPEAIFAAFVVAFFFFFVFLLLLFFSPKYRWRHLRHELFGFITAVEASNSASGRPANRWPNKPLQPTRAPLRVL